MPKVKDVLYHTVKFEVPLNPAQRVYIDNMSRTLRQLWNLALRDRHRAHTDPEFYATLFDPCIARLEAQGKNATNLRTRQAQFRNPEKKASASNFDQNYMLSVLRAQNARVNSLPASVARGTLTTLNGAYESFFALHKGGYRTSRRAGMRRPGEFCEIESAATDAVIKDGKFIFDRKRGLIFSVPKHCLDEIAQGLHVVTYKIFDDHHPHKGRRFWVAISFSIAKPEEKDFQPARAVYIALGASWSAVVFDRDDPREPLIIEMERHDKAILPRVRDIEVRIKEERKRAKPRVRFLRRWEKSRQVQLLLWRNRQKNFHRQLVHELIGLGDFYIIQDRRIREGMADGRKPGRTKLNWSVQNTGNLGRVAEMLQQKSLEDGGRVFKISPTDYRPKGTGRSNKIAMASRLRDNFLQQP